MNYRILFSLLFILFGCRSQETIKEGSHTFEHTFNPDRYTEIVEKWTQRRVVYSGFYNAFEFNVSFLNSEMREASKRYQAFYMQWPQDKLQIELNKALDDLNYNTYFFLSFFTPYAKDNNLSKKNSTWSIYLEAQGRRYEATVIKSTDEFSELVKLYPYHNRWSTPYIVKFRVPSSMAQNGPIKLTLAGPLGSAEVTFPK